MEKRKLPFNDFSITKATAPFIICPIIILCLMPIPNHTLCLKGIDFFYEFIDSQRIRNIPSPSDDCTC